MFYIFLELNFTQPFHFILAHLGIYTYQCSIFFRIVSQCFKASLDSMVRFLLCDLEVMSSNLGNNIFVCGGKTACIYPPRTHLVGLSFLLYLFPCVNVCASWFIMSSALCFTYIILYIF